MYLKKIDSTLQGKRILIVPDVRGWAFDFNFRDIASAIEQYVDGVKFVFTYGQRLSRGSADIALMSYWRQRAQIVDRPGNWVSGVSSWGWNGNGHCDGEVAPPPWVLERVSEFRAFYVANKNLYEHFKQLPRCHYVPFGVDTSVFRPVPRKENTELVVGWCGHAGRIKRQEVIEAAVAKVPGTTLRMRKYGTDSYTSDREEMSAFYNGLDVYVCASRAEGEPKTLKEAAACGVPLVSTGVGCADTLISPNVSGLFFNGTVTDLVEKLTYLRDNRPILREMRARVLARSAQYDMSFVALRWIRFFEECLGARS